MALRGLLADFHVHTSMSDGLVPLLEIIDIFGKGGVLVLNVADHLYDTITTHGKDIHQHGYCLSDWEQYTKEVGKARRFARTKFGMLVLQGAEITRAQDLDGTPGFHIVAVDLKEPVDANLPPEEIIKAIQKQGGIAISAHPYDKGPESGQGDRGNVFRLWENLETFRNIVDLWEIANGTVFYEKVAQEGLAFVADSDFHYQVHPHDSTKPSQFFSWKTVVQAKQNPDAIKKALLAQQIALKLVR